ncbi:Leucine-rich repeat, cysteine-containing subtype [Artemisia annua]|uniref:Leucine-rich repeat, cysteine-containing subtype n=1 Tax=Artemisia annua TaxID=35608 RepID=A0A2U1NBU2_ARTAN|nr:Leucine-rich repeat, cysteine-containing subtype [Artemisia annua]
MERIGEDELTAIFSKVLDRNDKQSFSKVSKQFLKVVCFRIRRLHSEFLDMLYVILPESPNIIQFRCTKQLSNAHMKLLTKCCPNIQRLDLSSRQDSNAHTQPTGFDFDDDGLCAVANACSHLRYVKLSRRLHVGDVGIVSLVRSCKKLEDLDLERCVGVTDESLKAIGEAGCVSFLNLRGCSLITDLGLEISDNGISHFKQMVGLDYLDLSKCGTNVTISGILAVSQIPNISRLNLSWLINVTNTSLSDIASTCRKLEVISFSGCEAITGEGLRAFAQHPSLKYLDMYFCYNFSWEDVVSVASTCIRLVRLGLSKRMKELAPNEVMDYVDFGHRRCWIDWKED